MTSTILGRPAEHWRFGLRTWAAMTVALYVAFWLQLDGASSAILTAAVLGLPTRGQAFSKALNRYIGTLLGVTASIVITALFADVRTLFLVAVAGWLALCAFAAGMLEGDRAYAAVLSGYTVGIVAVANIDAPGSVFGASINRGAAIAIGISATALISDLFSAPELLPGLLGRIEAVHAEVRAFSLEAIERGSAAPDDAARLIARITGLRADALLLRTESIAGRSRAASARRAISGMVRQARAARILAATLATSGGDGPAWRGRVAAALDDPRAADRLMDEVSAAAADPAASPRSLVAARGVELLMACDRRVGDALRDMASGRGPGRGPRLELYHPPRGAARTAARTFLAVVASSALLAAAGLPPSSTALVYVCMLSGLSAARPNPWTHATGLLVAVPIAAVSAGVTEFLLLDGVDAFPLLAIALLPSTLAGSLIMRAGRPLLAQIGFLLVVFTPELMSLSNVQKYDPQSYLSTSLYVYIAALLLTVGVATLLPTDDARRRGWILDAIRRELAAAAAGRRPGRLTQEEASFRSAERFGQLGSLAYPDEDTRLATLARAQLLSDITFACLTAHQALDALGEPAAGTLRRAIGTLDVGAMHAAAAQLRADARERWIGAATGRIAALIEHHAGDLADGDAAGATLGQR